MPGVVETDLRIGYLCDRPELAPALAAAHAEAFGPLLPDWSAQEALEELHSHRGRCMVPTTLVASDASGWLGSVSLLQNDHERIRQHSPWLASLYVRPGNRRHGIGRALVRRCVEDAATLAIPTLYLYCTEALVDYYVGMGWRREDRIALDTAMVQVLSIDMCRAGK
jgi:predicted N-acetyltransferase YhbS